MNNVAAVHETDCKKVQSCKNITLKSTTEEVKQCSLKTAEPVENNLFTVNKELRSLDMDGLEVPEFWADLDQRVYTSLGQAQQLLEQQDQLIDQLESEPVFWPNKDDNSFSALAADILMSISL
jgi:hypothetical protein